MKHYQKILVGVGLQSGEAGDEVLTPECEPAVARALRIARRHGAHVTFAHVFAVSRSARDKLGETGGGRASVLVSAQRVLDELVQQAAGMGVEAKGVLLYGKPWDEMNSCALQLAVDLIVVGSRCHGGLRRRVFGSTAQRVMSGSSVPVMIAHDDTPDSYKRVVIAADLSDGGREVVRSGLAMCYGSDCGVEVVHGVENWYEDRWHRAGYARESIEREHEEEKSRALAMLRHMVATVAKELGVDPPPVRVETGTPEVVIWNAATDRTADLVVMGLVGRTGFQQIWVGDTAERIFTELPCSVLTVRHRVESTGGSAAESVGE
jgi:universal stress protein E